jgi:hypothetical protein
LRYVIEMRTALVVIVAALALCGCGAVSGGAAPLPSDSPSIGPGVGFDVSVTEQTRAVTLRVGQKLEAALHARTGMTSWNGVRSSDTTILASIVNPAATSVRGVTLAAFQAISPGTTRITATAGPVCSPGMACPQYMMLLAIDVTVVA